MRSSHCSAATSPSARASGLLEEHAAEPVIRSAAIPLPSLSAVTGGHLMLGKDASYGVIGDAVRTIAPHSEAHEASLLFQFLAAAGNAIGPGPHFDVAGDHHRLNLYVAVVGDSGSSRKGTSWSYINQCMEGADPQWSENNIRSGLTSGPGLISQLSQMPDDARLLLVETELAPALGNAHRHSGALRDGWDKQALEVMSRNKPLRVTGAHLSMIGHMTQLELLSRLKERDIHNGLVNRILWVHTHRERLLPHGGCVPTADMARIQTAMKEAIEKARTVGVMTRDADASALWEAFYATHADNVSSQSVHSAVVQRGEAQVLRMSCIFAALDGSSVVQVSHLKAAIAAWNYAEASAGLIFESLEKSIPHRLTTLLKSRRRMTETEILTAFGRRHSGEIRAALKHLSDRGQVCWAKHRTAGRSTTTWYLAEDAFAGATLPVGLC